MEMKKTKPFTDSYYSEETYKYLYILELPGDMISIFTSSADNRLEGQIVLTRKTFTQFKKMLKKVPDFPCCDSVSLAK